jgi:hypothetical protein
VPWDSLVLLAHLRVESITRGYLRQAFYARFSLIKCIPLTSVPRNEALGTEKVAIGLHMIPQHQLFEIRMEVHLLV